MPKRQSERDSNPTADRLSIRLDLASGARIGPGKIAVLEEIARSGSISAAGRALRMSYRRTWELVEDLNRTLGTPVVETAAGGSGGGGAVLTRAKSRLRGRTLPRYRAGYGARRPQTPASLEPRLRREVAHPACRSAASSDVTLADRNGTNRLSACWHCVFATCAA